MMNGIEEIYLTAAGHDILAPVWNVVRLFPAANNDFIVATNAVQGGGLPGNPVSDMPASFHPCGMRNTGRGQVDDCDAGIAAGFDRDVHDSPRSVAPHAYAGTCFRGS